MAASVKLVVSALLLSVVVVSGRSSGGVLGLEDSTGAALASSTAPAPLVARLHLAFSGMDDVVVVDGGTAVGLQAADGEGGQQGGGGWMMECWSAVTELRSCTNEIVLFFINGESYLGRDCCIAIRTVTRHCWPSMLASVGFTAEEADVLRGFCDAEVGAHSPPPATPVMPPAAPAPAPAPSRAYV